MIFASIGIVLFMVSYFVRCFYIIPPYEGFIIARFGKPVRTIGPGLRWAWWLIEKPVSGTYLEKQNMSFEAEFETAANEPVRLSVVFEYEPVVSRLIQFLSFERKEIPQLLMDRVKSIFSILVRTYPNRTSVLNNIGKIADDAKVAFGPDLEEYYGIKFLMVVIIDPVLPEVLREAIVQGEAVVVLNQNRRLEIENLQALAKSLVEDAKAQGVPLDYATALNVLQIQFGKASKDIKEIKLEGSVAEFLAKAINNKLAN